MVGTIDGGAGSDALSGMAHSDTIFGGADEDRLTGAGDRDLLTGGDGADTFIYRKVADSSTAHGGRDTILDFRFAQSDTIDLHLIDASTKKGGDQAFRFIGDHAFTHEADELQEKFVGANSLLNGGVDGDGKADLSILVHAHVSFHEGDFVL